MPNHIWNEPAPPNPTPNFTDSLWWRLAVATVSSEAVDEYHIEGAVKAAYLPTLSSILSSDVSHVAVRLRMLICNGTICHLPVASWAAFEDCDDVLTIMKKIPIVVGDDSFGHRPLLHAHTHKWPLATTQSSRLAAPQIPPQPETGGGKRNEEAIECWKGHQQ